MNGRVALGAALTCAAAAIALVAVDMQFNLEARLEGGDGSTWQTVAKPGRWDGPYPVGCPTHVRLVVDNDRLFSADVRVHASISGPDGQASILLDDTWHVGRGEGRIQELSIPPAVFESGGGPAKPQVFLQAQVDNSYLGTCVKEA